MFNPGDPLSAVFFKDLLRIFDAYPMDYPQPVEMSGDEKSGRRALNALMRLCSLHSPICARAIKIGQTYTLPTNAQLQ
jgi:hypothetical protein